MNVVEKNPMEEQPGELWTEVLKSSDPHVLATAPDDQNVQKLYLDKDTFRIKTPFRMALSGPSCAGKSTYLLKLMENHDVFFDKKFDHYFYCFPEDVLYHARRTYIEKLGRAVDNLKICEGFPDVLMIGRLPGSKFIFFDDMFEELIAKKEFLKLMQTQSHEFDISLAFSTQNLYAQSKVSFLFLPINGIDEIILHLKFFSTAKDVYAC